MNVDDSIPEPGGSAGPPRLSESERARQHAIAAVARQLAEWTAADERAARAVHLNARPRRRRTGTSVVFSIRLDPAELDALENQAAVSGIKPSVLARNYVRVGLSARGGDEVVGAVDRLDAAVGELRSLVR